MRKIIFVLVLLITLISCNNQTADLETTIDAQNTRLALLPEDSGLNENIPPTNIPSTAISDNFSHPLLPTLSSQSIVESTKEQSINMWSAKTERLWFANTDKFFIQNVDGQLETRDKSTGELIWSNPLQGEILNVDSEHIYIAPSDQRIDAHSVENGELVWTALLPDKLSKFFKLILAGDVFAETNNSYIWIDKDTGEILSQFPYFGDPIAQDLSGNVIIFRKDRNTIAGFSSETGQILWESSNSDREGICNDLFVTFDSDGEMATIEATEIYSGNKKWTSEIPLNAINSHIICSTNTFSRFHLDEFSSNNIYFPADEFASLVALDRGNGELKWSGNNQDYNWLGEVDDQIIYSHNGFNLTQAYDVENHQKIWENTQILLSKIIGTVDDIIIGTVEASEKPTAPYEITTTIIGLDKNSGEEVWRQELDQNEEASFSQEDERIANVILVGNHLLFTIKDDNIVTFIDPFSGEILEKRQVEIKEFENLMNVVEDDGYFIQMAMDGVLVVNPVVD